MKQLTFGACIKKGWISSWQVVTHMPWLFLGVCAVLACTSLLAVPHPSAATAADGADPMTRLGQGLLPLVWAALQLVVGGTLTIKVHRFVLLGEGVQPLVPLNGKPLGRYALVSLAVVLMTLVFAGLGYAAMRMVRFGILIYLPMLAIYLFIAMRLILLYPAIALGSRLALRAAWKDSRGHVWSMIGVGFITYLPLFVLSAIFLTFAGPHMLAAHQTQSATVIAIVQALLNAVFIVFAAASLSWLYRRYASELLKHAQDAPQ
jgi:hypothetical protein